MIVHAERCRCGRCLASQERRLRLALAEERAGREHVERERRPRPGTWRALHETYGPKRRL